MNIDRELLYRFFHQTTNLEEEVKIRRWIEESDENYREFFRERALFDAILLQGKITSGVKKDRSSFFWREVLLVASGMAAVVLLTMTLTVNYLNSSLQGEKMNTIVVPQGQRVNLTLADGTHIWLNAKTTMEYPQSFAGSDRRRVKIDGEAYFEVTKDAHKPFLVETSKGSVKVLGTKFYVSAYESTNEFEAALMEGKVDVRTKNGNLTLLPNYKAVLENGKLVRKAIENMDAYRWRDGLYCFKELTFEEVLEQFTIYYDVQFVKENDQISNPKITGKFRLLDGVDYALRVLQREVGFTYWRDEETNILKSATFLLLILWCVPHCTFVLKFKKIYMNSIYGT